MELMIDPVICSDGYSYERCAIEQWLNSNNRSPMTNLALEITTLFPNRALLSKIREYRERLNNESNTY